jgi:hypothetical protein
MYEANVPICIACADKKDEEKCRSLSPGSREGHNQKNLVLNNR